MIMNISFTNTFRPTQYVLIAAPYVLASSRPCAPAAHPAYIH